MLKNDPILGALGVMTALTTQRHSYLEDNYVHMKKFLISAFAGALAAGAGLSASATSLIQLDLKGLVDQSAVVVVAEATGQHAANTASGLQTMTTFSVSDAVIGNASTLTVAVPGGAITNGKYKLAQTWPGAPRFIQGQEVLMFLSDAAGDGNYRVVGFSQGSMAVVNTVQGKMVQMPGDNLGPVSLASAIAEIRKVQNGQRGSTKSLD